MSKICFLSFTAICLMACNTNKTDTINKTSKIDSGRNDAPTKTVYLKGDSSNVDTNKRDTIMRP